MNSLITYFLLGISLAAPIGPVNAAQLDNGIKHGFFSAWVFGIGALLADVLYMLFVYLGVIKFIDMESMKTFLWFFGCFVLTYTGIESLIKKEEFNLKSEQRGRQLLSKSLFSGFLISISNPLTILFWLGIYGSVLAQTASKFTHDQLLVYSSAMIAGILLWDFTMASLSSLAKNIFHKGFLRVISAASSLSMIGFGIYFGIQAVKALI
ncbi:LysE family transporter [Bacillus haikouensis]|jgi:L-lysine exporter family protein LysE/ArgO|uniref:LysE family transporter n=1 Tax=Bacillus haikouensis TaxID=1510468 RepID=UPI001551F03E|nr:LysE family transporter [Bacillus haikouensis]NQD64429.1 LysE family transporter [Bacillus haikouensis]